MALSEHRACHQIFLTIFTLKCDQHIFGCFIQHAGLRCVVAMLRQFFLIPADIW
jgi:hypothetical protein